MADSGIMNRRTSVHDDDQKQSTSDMFKDILSQKRNMIMSKLTSFDSDVSISCKRFLFLASKFGVSKNKMQLFGQIIMFRG